MQSAENKAETVPPMGVSAREAAKLLGVGERLLWAKTKTGEIPHLRIGRRVVYPVDLLREYIEAQARGKR